MEQAATTLALAWSNSIPSSALFSMLLAHTTLRRVCLMNTASPRFPAMSVFVFGW
jgi:hypothetical protein